MSKLRKVVRVEFTKPVLLEAGNPMPVRTLKADTEMYLDGAYIVVGKRRFSTHSSVVESFDLE